MVSYESPWPHPRMIYSPDTAGPAICKLNRPRFDAVTETKQQQNYLNKALRYTNVK